MNYKVILFDVDGLVITSERFSARLERDYETPWEAMRPFFEGPFTQCKLGHANLKAELEKVLRAWNWRGSVDDLLSYWFKDMQVSEEVIELVQKLRLQGVRCYLATNQTSERAEYLLNNLKLGTRFDGIYNSAQLGYLKSDPAFFEKILENERIASDQILLIDHDEPNLKAAQVAGIATHYYTNLSTLTSFLGL